MHRKIKGKIKQCTIRKDIDQWYACFSVECNKHYSLPKTNRTIGVDVGLKSLITTSEGEQIDPPKFLKKAEHKLKRLHRWFSRKIKGSKNWYKFKVILAKGYRKVRRQRLDFNHNLSWKLVNSFDKIIFEELNIKNMVRNHKLAKSILDASWYQLIEMTKYKAEWAGRVVELVEPNRTSMTCFKCGNVQPMPLHKRIYKCEKCGFELDRDINASINIKNKATCVQRGSYACGDYSLEGRRSRKATQTKLAQWLTRSKSEF